MKRPVRLLLAVIAAIIPILFWKVNLCGQGTMYEEVSLEDGETDIQFPFPEIRHIVVCNNDAGYRDPEEETISCTIELVDSRGETAGVFAADFTGLHTNAYSSTESTAFSGLPAAVDEEETYTVRYTAETADRGALTHLSFMFYGADRSLDRVTLLLCLLLSAAAFTALFLPAGTKLKYGIIAALLLAHTVFFMPALETATANASFAKEYGGSDRLFGKTAVDENGAVYIDESGVRNMDRMTYAVPVMRFWSDYKSGNKEGSAVSTLYTGNSGFDPLLLPATLAVTAARGLHLPYQWIFIFVWLVNGALTAALLAVSLKLLRKQELLKGTAAENGWPLGSLFVLPEFLIASISYDAGGIFLTLLLLTGILLCIAGRSRKGRRETDAAAKGKRRERVLYIAAIAAGIALILHAALQLPLLSYSSWNLDTVLNALTIGSVIDGETLILPRLVMVLTIAAAATLLLPRGNRWSPRAEERKGYAVLDTVNLLGIIIVYMNVVGWIF